MEPVYEEDIVNLGYLKKIINETEKNIGAEYENVSRTFATKPQPPYHKGDIWIEGNSVYTCINDREIGLFNLDDWTTESGAKEDIKEKNKIYLTKPSDYSIGDMWILQSDNDHKAGKKGEILITIAGRSEYNEDDWINMLSYGGISSINEVANNLNNAIERIGNVEEAIEDGVITTYYQSTIPDNMNIGDLWFVTENIDNYIKGKLYRFNGDSWEMLNDPAISEAFEEANEARLIADGKIQSFYSETEPTKNVGVGDLWIDISNNNQLYRYNGTNWIGVYDTRVENIVEELKTISKVTTEISTDLGKITQTVTETTTKVNGLEDKMQAFKNVSGENVHVNDSSDLKFLNLSVRGNQKQEIKNSSNLYDFDVEQDNRVTVHSDGTFTINGKGSFNLKMKDVHFKADRQFYYFRFELVSGTISGIENPFLVPNTNRRIYYQQRFF